MYDWRKALELSQLVLWVIVHKAGTALLDGKSERARWILERFQYSKLNEDDDTGDFEDPEASEPEFEYLEADTPWREKESDEDEPNILIMPDVEAQSLLAAMGMNLAELVEASHCYRHNTMGFSFLLQMEDLCALFYDLIGETEVENFVTQYLKLSAHELEVTDLLEVWNGFEELCFCLHEEAAYQWLLAGDLLAQAIIVDDPTVASPQLVQKAIGEVIASRKNGQLDLPAKFESALAVLQPRLLEIARTSNTDSDQVFELFDMCGGKLNSNLAASKVPAAVNNYLRLVAEKR